MAFAVRIQVSPRHSEVQLGGIPKVKKNILEAGGWRAAVVDQVC